MDRKFKILNQDDPAPDYETPLNIELSPNDAAATPITRYDPAAFCLPATDERGNFEKVDVRMPPDLRHQMLAIVNTKKFPYGSEKDLMRHAIVRHATWLHTLEQDIPYYVPNIEVVAQIERDRVKHELFIESIQTSMKALQHYIKGGVYSEARKYYLRVLEEVDKIRTECKEEYWGGRYRETLMAFLWLLHVPETIQEEREPHEEHGEFWME